MNKINKNESRKNGNSSIAQQSVTCQSNNSGLYIAYAFDHREMTFEKVILGKKLNVALKQAALLVDRYTTECGSLAQEFEDNELSYALGFITAEEKASEDDDLFFSETFDDWDEAVRMWTNNEAGITIGMASMGELIKLLPDENLIELIQLIEEFVEG